MCVNVCECRGRYVKRKGGGEGWGGCVKRNGGGGGGEGCCGREGGEGRGGLGVVAGGKGRIVAGEVRGVVVVRE